MLPSECPKVKGWQLRPFVEDEEDEGAGQEGGLLCLGHGLLLKVHK